MRGTIAAAIWLLLAPPLCAATVTAAWDANTDGVTVGYRVFYGLASGAETVPVEAGMATTLTLTLAPNTRYFFIVKAYNAANALSPPSNEVSWMTGADTDPCAYPLGAKSVSVFPTKLTTTGSGQAGSKARIDFQVGSPNSPVVRTAIRTMGADVSVVSGSDLSAIAGQWFTVPAAPATYNFSVAALNAAGCVREQTTTYAITVR